VYSLDQLRWPGLSDTPAYEASSLIPEEVGAVSFHWKLSLC
jgi:hypothetical protein